ncbi:lactonase family protein [Antarcticibacterium arcticum]|nr:lactonase family protein [Antarcticibacterium arcticum]
MNTKIKKSVPVLLGVIVLFSVSCKLPQEKSGTVPGKASREIAYIGTYTKKEGHVDGKGEGIYKIYQDPSNGKLKFGSLAANIINPSFIKVSADKENLYAVSELGPGDAGSGFIHSYNINKDNSLVETGKLSTEGFAPCYIAEDPTGNFIFVANYVGGVVMMYEKNPDGSLIKKENITFEDPENSHPHSVTISANARHFYVADLGHDKIWIFDLNVETAEVKPNNTPFIQLKEGAGPRHFSIDASGNFAYSINELNSTISSFKIEDTGALVHLDDISSIPENFIGKNSAADINLHPAGNFLYVSNRGHNSIAAFNINPETGLIELLGFTSTQGDIPRNFAISKDGTYLYAANQNSNNITGFSINPATGKLESTGVVLGVNTPVCIEFMR